MNVLIVDDEPTWRHMLHEVLRQLPGLHLLDAANLAEARAALREHPVDLVLIDIQLGQRGNRDGLVLVGEVRQRTSAVPIVVTLSSERVRMREAMRQGAYDYILKDDLSEEMVLPIIEGLQRRLHLQREVSELRARLSGGDMVGLSVPMQRLRDTIQRVARSDQPVLVLGPTGSGKELVAQAIHHAGPHPEAPLQVLNCGGLPERLIESELFGHVRGAFSGAERRRDGFLVATGRGTLFLDEIAELPLELQPKLLRVIEYRRFTAVGSEQEQQFQGRVVAAANRDLHELVQKGLFREDLFYRLNVLSVSVPPLDERREDIPALVAHFLRGQQRQMRFSAEAMELLLQAPWHGNVRELRNLIEWVVVMAEEDLVTREVVASRLTSAVDDAAAQGQIKSLARALLRQPVRNKLADLERELVHEALEQAGGCKSQAARLIGIHRKKLERMLQRFGSGEPDPEPEQES